MSFQSLAFFGFLAAALAVCLTAGRRSPRMGAALLAAPRFSTFLAPADRQWCWEGSPACCWASP